MPSLAESSLLASMKARMPAVLVGPPGVGKTATMRNLAERMGYELITIVGSQLDPTDIVGLPKGELLGKTEDGQDIYGTVNLSPWWQVRILKDKKIVLFLDEMSNTPAQVRASMLTLLQDREFPNGLKMPKETIVVGAMNPTEEAADGNDLDYPTTNRINFIVWSPPVSDWKTGMLRAWGKEVSAEEMEWRKRIVNFIESMPSQLQKLPSDTASPQAYGVDPNNASEVEVLRYAWPSRRSWDNLSRVLPYAKNNTAVEDTLAQGIVGYSAAVDFREWLNTNTSITPEQLLRDPKGYNWSNSNLSEAKSLLRSILEFAKDERYSTRAIVVFEEIANQGQQSLAAGDIAELGKITTNPKFQQEIVQRNRQRFLKLAQQFQQINSAMK